MGEMSPIQMNEAKYEKLRGSFGIITQSSLELPWNCQNNATQISRESGRSCTLDVGCWSGSFVMRPEVTQPHDC